MKYAGFARVNYHFAKGQVWPLLLFETRARG